MTQPRCSELVAGQHTKMTGHAALSPNDAVERVILRLNTLCRKATLEFAVSVGKLIIDDLYDGDLAAWRLRGPKSASFRKLAMHPDLPMSPGSLYRSVAMYEMSRRLGIGNWRHISTSHMRVVLPLPAEEQSKLLAAAEAGKWPVGRLMEEVTVRRKSLPAPLKNRGGRRPRSRLRSTIVHLEQSLNAASNALGVDDRSADLAPDSAHSIIDALERIRETCNVVEKRVEDLLTRGGDNPSPSPRAMQGEDIDAGHPGRYVNEDAHRSAFF